MPGSIFRTLNLGIHPGDKICIIDFPLSTHVCFPNLRCLKTDPCAGFKPLINFILVLIMTHHLIYLLIGQLFAKISQHLKSQIKLNNIVHFINVSYMSQFCSRNNSRPLLVKDFEGIADNFLGHSGDILPWKKLTPTS